MNARLCCAALAALWLFACVPAGSGSGDDNDAAVDIDGGAGGVGGEGGEGGVGGEGGFGGIGGEGGEGGFGGIGGEGGEGGIGGEGGEGGFGGIGGEGGFGGMGGMGGEGGVGGEGGMGGMPEPCLDPVVPCDTDIYAAHDPEVLPMGVQVRVSGVVTANRVAGEPTHLVIQVSPDAPGYRGPEHSGIWIYLGDAIAPLDVALPLPRGTRVTVVATTNDFFDQRQLFEVASITVDGQGPPIGPTLAPPGALATGGPLSEVYEGVLVEVRGHAVIDVAPPVGPGDRAPINEFVLRGGLRVDDYIHLIAPRPVVGSYYERIAGVMRFGNGDAKLIPRDANDVERGAAQLIGFGPDGASIRVGDIRTPDLDGVPLTVQFDVEAQAAQRVQLSTDRPGRLAVPPFVDLAPGTDRVEVVMEGLAPGAAEVTAELGGTAVSATVEVLAAGAVPTDAVLVGLPPTMQVGQQLDAQIELDVPAAAPTPVQVAYAPPGIVAGPPAVPFARNDRVQPLPIAALAVGRVQVTLTLDGRAVDVAEVEVIAGAPFVVNEIDYDQPGEDTTDFVELLAVAPLELSDYRVELINGANDQVYAGFDLGPGPLAAGGRVVVGTALVVDALPAGVVGVVNASIQNGPDGVRIVEAATGAVVDSMAYERSIEGVVEGEPPAIDSGANGLSRCPDGVDSDDNSADFILVPPTPGLPNACP